VRGWFKFDDDELDAEDRLVFRFTINNPAKYENKDNQRPGDRMLALTILKDGDLHFDTYTYNNDWSTAQPPKKEFQETSSNDLYSWIYVYFGVNLDKN